MIRISILMFLPALFLLSGCAGAAGKASVIIKVDAEVIFSSSNCIGIDQTAGAFWITDEREFVSLMNKLKGQKIGGSAVTIPAVDFEKDGVLLIRMGRKPTGGYGIELASKQAEIQNQTAVVTVRWIEPAKGAILAQMITSPCVMIKIAKGSYTAVRVVDQNGVFRAEIKINHP